MLVSADTNISGGLGPLNWLVGLNLPSESLQRIGWELSSFRAGWLSLDTMRRWRTFWLAGPRLWLSLGGPVQPRKPELRPGLLARLLGPWCKVSPALRGDGCLSIKGRTIETPIGLCAELNPACASLDHSFLFEPNWFLVSCSRYHHDFIYHVLQKPCLILFIITDIFSTMIPYSTVSVIWPDTTEDNVFYPKPSVQAVCSACSHIPASSTARI